jgi:group I intron endonuclease
VNGKQYVGQTTLTIQQRMAIHKKVSKTRSYPLYHAFKKYGLENFTIEELATCNTFDELNTLEQKFIIEFNTLAPKGYNLTPGGRKGTHTQETRDKISAALTGRIFSESHRAAIRLSKTKENHPNWQKHLRIETRQKMSAAAKGKRKSAIARLHIKQAAIKRFQNHIFKPASCHPDRKHKAKGLCRFCYDHQRRIQN